MSASEFSYDKTLERCLNVAKESELEFVTLFTWIGPLKELPTVSPEAV